MKFHVDSSPKVTAVILAGGLGRRMGGRDKGLIPLDGRPLISHVIDILKGQVDRIIINSPDSDSYLPFGYPVVADGLADNQGPLAGLLAAMENTDDEFILAVPCDAPLLPSDLVPRMYRALISAGADVCTVHDGERLHPVIALVKKKMAEGLHRFLADGRRKVRDWLKEQAYAVADFSDCENCFLNINTSDDLSTAKDVIRKRRFRGGVPVLGFVAWSGTGKTTLLEKIIPLLRQRGLRVGLLKHAHHDFDIDRPGKDSYRLRKAGASQVMVASRHRWALITEDDTAGDEPRLWELLSHLSTATLDLVLVEGFKHERFPKIVLQRKEVDKPALHEEDPDVIALATDTALKHSRLPVLNINNPKMIADFICNDFLKMTT